MSKKEVASAFGISLDRDDFSATKNLLDDKCQYFIGKEILQGPSAICKSYEDNMIEGRKKLDKLEWGQSQIEEINNNEFYVHFTDYLTHKNEKYTHKCKQKLTVGSNDKIVKIEHIANPTEQERLNEFYMKVGLK